MVSLHASRGDEPIFHHEIHGKTLVLTIVEDPRCANYGSRQHEYNRIYRDLGEATGTHLLFDLHRCRILDSVTIGILVSLTSLCRSGGGNSAISGISEDVTGMLARLMLLQPDNRRTMWQTFPTREEAMAFLQPAP